VWHRVSKRKVVVIRYGIFHNVHYRAPLLPSIVLPTSLNIFELYSSGDSPTNSIVAFAPRMVKLRFVRGRKA
jgi:hypothetical protein